MPFRRTLQRTSQEHQTVLRVDLPQQKAKRLKGAEGSTEVKHDDLRRVGELGRDEDGAAG
jgi:hypothetical protein